MTNRDSERSQAWLYTYRALDALIESAIAVAHDAAERPSPYCDASDETLERLEKLRSLTGTHPDWPSKEQRKVVSGAILAPFSSESTGFRGAISRLAEAGSTSSERLLRSAFTEEAVLLRGALDRLYGRASRRSEVHVGEIFEQAISVLSDPSIAAVFGMPPIPSGTWPDGGYLGPDMAFLMEEISRSLPAELVPVPMTRERFSLLQRLAHHGSETLKIIVDPRFPDIDGELRSQLDEDAYSWCKALDSLGLEVDSVRAWKDPDYREDLDGIEQDAMARHPAGASIFLGGAGGLGLQTFRCSTDFCSDDCKTKTPVDNPCSDNCTYTFTTDASTVTDWPASCCSTGSFPVCR